MSVHGKQLVDNTVEPVKLNTVGYNPNAAGDITTVGYVTAILEGLKPKEAVKAGTTANIADLNAAPSSLDGITLLNGDRVLLKDQTDPIENGVYDYNAGILTRSADFDDSPANEVVEGTFVFISQGLANGGSGWFVSGTASSGADVVVGTDPLIFSKRSDVVGYVEGNGINFTGNTISIDNGDGLSFNGTALTLNLLAGGALTNGASGVGVDADGINETHIDFGSGADQIDATSIPLDTGGTYAGAAANVQDALEEIESAVAALNPTLDQVLANGSVLTASRTITGVDQGSVTISTSSTAGNGANGQAVFDPNNTSISASFTQGNFNSGNAELRISGIANNTIPTNNNTGLFYNAYDDGNGDTFYANLINYNRGLYLQASSDIGFAGEENIVTLDMSNAALSSLTLHSQNTFNFEFRDDRVTKTGFRLTGFGETDIDTEGSVSYAGLVFNSLVPKKYVDDAVAAGAITLTDGNGTTAGANNIDLGGTITADTTFTGTDQTIRWELDGVAVAGADEPKFEWFIQDRVSVSDFSEFFITIDAENDNILLSSTRTVGQGGSVALGTSINSSLSAIDLRSFGTSSTIQSEISLTAVGITSRFVSGGNDSAITIDANGVTITDAIGSAGASYAADYSVANAANPRWIVDKAYVDGAIAGASQNLQAVLNAGASATITSNFSVTTDSGINLSDTDAGNGIQISSAGDPNAGSGGNVTISAIDDDSNNFTRIEIGSGFTPSTSNITISSDRANFAGATYAADYSANFGNRSLVDKEYVDDAIVAGAFTLANGEGTTANGSAVDIGGAISGLREVTISATANQKLDIYADTSEGVAGLVIGTTLSGNVGGNITASDIVNTGSTTSRIALYSFETDFSSFENIKSINADGWKFVQGTDLDSVPVITTFTMDFNDGGISLGGDYSANQGNNHLVTKGYVDGEIAAATLSAPTGIDKANNPSNTTGDEATTGITITNSPTGILIVSVNGVIVSVGDGVKTRFCYFSADGGTTAKNISAIAAGDTLYWNGVVANYDLATTDEVDFYYI